MAVDMESPSTSDSADPITLPDFNMVNVAEDLEDEEYDGLITKDMVEEEEKMHEETLKEEMALKQKAAEDERREQCFKRLQHLLTRSNFYANFLIQKIESQLQQKKIEEQKASQQKQRQQLKALQPKGQVGIRKSTRVTSKEQGDNQENEPEGKEHEGQKRKLSESMEQDQPKKAHKKARNKEASLVDYVDKETLVQCAEQGIAENNAENTGGDSSDSAAERISMKQPVLFTGGEMRSYQLEGLEWLKVLYENGINGILADEMGLGKTVQCIALIAYLIEMGISGPFIICAPLSTLPNWVMEFQRFTPQIPVLLYHGHHEKRKDLRRALSKPKYTEGKRKVFPVVITSYEIVMHDRRYFTRFQWRYMIIDEGHRIKNFKCRLSRELKQYNSVNRLLLTGTPLQNNLAELWSLLNFLLPEIFDDLEVFESWFDVRSMASSSDDEKIIEQEKEMKIISTIHQILSPFMLRRTKADVELNLPPKKELLVYAPLMPHQEKLYRAAVDRTIRQLVNNEQEEAIVISDPERGPVKRKASMKKINYADFDSNNLEVALNAIQSLETPAEQPETPSENPFELKEVNLQMKNIMMLLRKICNHPFLVEYPLNPYTHEYRITEALISRSGKMRVLDCLLKELKKGGHKVLIFSQMTSMLDILEDFCSLRRYEYCRLDGRVGIEDRQAAINEFNSDPKIFLFLISTRAGGLGINLTAADTVIIYDSDWNPQADLQAQDRCHRIGQTKPVIIYRLVTANTIDQQVIERASAKRKLEKLIIHQGNFSSLCSQTKRQKHFDVGELAELLNSKDHQNVINTGEREVFTPEELEALLDRSDMLAPSQKNAKRKESDKDRQHSEKFKVLDADDC